MSGRENGSAGRKCPGCGGVIVYDSKKKKFVCSSCGKEFRLPPGKSIVEEYDFSDYFRREGELMMEGGEVFLTCPNCGSEIIIPKEGRATVCPMCGAPQLRPSEKETGIPVEGIIPFAVDRYDAQKAFGGWIKKRWFAPNELKKLFAEGKLTGTYVPFWTYDVDASADYTGRGGTFVTVVGKDGKRKTETQWKPVSGTVSASFNDLQVCASEKMAGSLIEHIAPFDSVHNTKPYQTEYLHGYQAERYTISGVDGFDQVKSQVQNELETRAEDDIRSGKDFDEADVKTCETTYRSIRYKHILVPVWHAQYGYKGRQYHYLINGESGTVYADYPKSPIKIVLTVLIAALAIFALFKLQQHSSSAEALPLPDAGTETVAEERETMQTSGEALTEFLERNGGAAR